MLAAVACAAGRAAPSVETLPCHGAPTPYKLYVTSQGVRSNHGYLVANLYGADKRRWLADNGWLAVWRDPAMPGDETMCLYLPAPGRYALVMFHDANADGDLNLGPLGTEGGLRLLQQCAADPERPAAALGAVRRGPGETRVTIRLRYPPLS